MNGTRRPFLLFKDSKIYGLKCHVNLNAIMFHNHVFKHRNLFIYPNKTEEIIPALRF